MGNWCQGLPGSVAACRSADGLREHPLLVGGIDATAYAALLQSLAVAAEVFMFLALGSIADFGATKRRAFIAASVLGAVTTLFFGGLTPDTWWLASPAVIISNVMFGFTSMLLSAFLPGIVRGLPTVQREAAEIAAQYFPELIKSAEGTLAIAVLQCGQGEAAQHSGEGGVNGDPPPPMDSSPPLEGETLNAAAEPPTPGTDAMSSRAPGLDPPLPADGGGAPDTQGPRDSSSPDNGSPIVVPMSAVGSDSAKPEGQQQSVHVAGSASVVASVGAIAAHVEPEQGVDSPFQKPEVGTELHISAKTAALSSLFQLVEHEGNVLSNRGYGMGYVGGLACLILVIPFTIFLEDTLLAYNLGIMVAAVWWLGGVIILAPRIRDRRGRERPPGKNILQLSLAGLCETVAQIRQLPQSRNFLLCWFLLSDGVSVQVTVGALFANSFVEWGCIPKSIGLAVVILMIPLFGIAGNFGTLWASRRYGWSPKSVVQGILFITCVVPLYGLVGFASNSIGIHQGFELFYIAAILGVASALTQAFSRSVFVTLIPAGYESSWSSLFELTNKSSSFVGPAIVAAFAQAGLLRLSFIYILFMLLIPAIALFWVDERLGAREARGYSKQQLAMKLRTPVAEQPLAPEEREGNGGHEAGGTA